MAQTKLTDDIDGVGADDGLGQLDVLRVTDDNRPLCHLVDMKGDVGGGDEAALRCRYNLGAAVDPVVIDYPLDLRYRIRDVRRTGDGHTLFSPCLLWPGQLYAGRSDWKKKKMRRYTTPKTMYTRASQTSNTYTERLGPRGWSWA